MKLLQVRRPAVVAVFRHAWRQLVYAPATYVFMAGFLLALSAGVFLAAGFADSDYASLDSLWTVLPFAAIVLVPAFAMRAFSADGQDRALELTMTMPLSDFEVVLGTWLAGTALLLVTLAATAPIAATVAYLGAPDWGAMAGGYLGAALLLATYYAIALFASAITRDQVAAYIAAVGLLLLVTLPGSDMAARLVRLPASVTDALGLISPAANLARMATGCIELSAILNFVILSALVLWLAAIAIDDRRAGTNAPGSAFNKAGKGALAILGGLSLMTIAATVDVQADLTEGRQYTLHPATIAAARALPSSSAINLYWSESEAGVPARIRAYAHRVKRLLARVARASGVSVYTHDTAPDTEADWAARGHGIRRVPLSTGESFMLGAVIDDNKRRHTFDYLDIDRAGLLEYDLALAMTRLGETRTRTIGIVSPLFTPTNLTEPREGLSFIASLKGSYDIAIVPFFADALPEGLDVVIVIGGALLKPSMLAAIEQHAAAGRGLIVCLDPHTRFNPSSDATVPAVTGRNETIADLLDRRGIRFEATVTGDETLAAPVVGEDQTKTAYPFWLRVPRAQINAAHPATASLVELLFAEPGSFTLAPGGAAVSLVTTTAQSGTLPAEAFKSAAPAKLIPDGRIRTLSAFVPPAIFAVADVDWLFDPLAIQDAGSPAARPLNDNHAFLANMIDASSGDTRLLEMRTRSSASRRFTRIEALLKSARVRLGPEEIAAQARITKIETTIGEILKAAKVSRVADLPAGIGTRIEQLNIALIPTRRRLGEIRREMREEVTALGRTLAAANLASGPLLTLAFAALMFRFRRRARLPAPGTPPNAGSRRPLD